MIGLCLKYEQTNYGSKLQALATINVVEQLGYNFQIIHYAKGGFWFKIKSLSRVLNSTFRQDKIEDFSRRRAIKRHPVVAQSIQERKRMFKEFDAIFFDKYEIRGKYYKDIKRIATTYDSVVSCSDQLWSPAGLGTNFYNLMFVPDHINKVSFASSFGVSQIPWYQKKATANYLNRIEHVSCRENRGAEIVKELTGRDVPVLMDPVFAFDIDEWLDIVPKEIIYDEPYVFCYFLGNNSKHRILATEFARKKGLKIVCMRHLDQYVAQDESFGDIAPYDASPLQFLNILRGANYVVTDSFHGCAFSIIMKKEFVVLYRYASNSVSSKNSRIDSVCANLGLSDRIANEDSVLEDFFKKEIDWSSVVEKQTLYRVKMWNYLKSALSINEENENTIGK